MDLRKGMDDPDELAKLLTTIRAATIGEDGAQLEPREYECSLCRTPKSVIQVGFSDKRTKPAKRT